MVGLGSSAVCAVRISTVTLGAAAIAVLLYFLLMGGTERATPSLIAFDGGALAFLAAVWVMMARATPESMRRRAQLEDESRYTV